MRGDRPISNRDAAARRRFSRMRGDAPVGLDIKELSGGSEWFRLTGDRWPLNRLATIRPPPGSR